MASPLTVRDNTNTLPLFVRADAQVTLLPTDHFPANLGQIVADCLLSLLPRDTVGRDVP
jgi:hypothetical protein